LQFYKMGCPLVKPRKLESGCQFHQHSTSSFSTHADPKSIKMIVKLSSFFTLSGSACVKSAFKTLMKLTTGEGPIILYKYP